MPAVLIYTRPFCPYCSRALALLRAKNVAFTEVDDASFNSERRQEMLSRSGGAATYPQIFIGDRHIGGCDDMMALERAGQLDALLGL
jgi:glutaredoxin 3